MPRASRAARALCPTLLLSRDDSKESPRDTRQFVRGAIYRSVVYRRDGLENYDPSYDGIMSKCKVHFFLRNLNNVRKIILLK